MDFQAENQAAGKAADAGATPLSLADLLGANPMIGPMASILDLVSSGSEAAAAFHDGHELDGAVKAGKGAGSALELIGGIGHSKILNKLGSGLGAATSGIESVQSFHKGDPLHGIMSAVDAASSGLDMVGGKATPISWLLKAFSTGGKIGDKGNELSADMNLFGTDRDGKSRDMSGAIADHSFSVHDRVMHALGDTEAANIAGHVAGVGTMVGESIGGTVAAPFLAAGGYARDAWKYITSHDGREPSSLFHGLF
jgi:hypothetical protein